MNGAQSLLRTLVESGVELCLANPGTSEMHLVAALDREPGMRSVLGLFEGVVTGAADGYARMTGTPACTLLHLGPGLANGLANLHNARRARVPLVNIVGDHAIRHGPLDAPLTSDIAALAHTVSGWVRTADDPARVAEDGARAVAASYGPPGRIATLILPADVAWNEAGPPAAALPVERPAAPEAARIEAVADLLRSEPGGAVFLLNGSAVGEDGLALAGRICRAVGARLFSDTFVTRASRGAGRVTAPRLPYLAERALEALEGARRLILVETKAPVAFFAYPGVPGELTPDGCSVHSLAEPGEDGVQALGHLAEALDLGDAQVPAAPLRVPDAPTGVLDPDTVAEALAHHLPEGAIVVNESNTAGRAVPARLATARPHDWLDITGGAIGQGMPVATGAALACPDRKVLSLEADGSGMYTLQALWTQAREGLDVTTVVLSNRAYAILDYEYRRTGAGEPGRAARRLFDLSDPELGWVELARGMGVEGCRVETAENFAEELGRALAEPGPRLIEVVL